MTPTHTHARLLIPRRPAMKRKGKRRRSCADDTPVAFTMNEEDGFEEGKRRTKERKKEMEHPGERTREKGRLHGEGSRPRTTFRCTATTSSITPRTRGKGRKRCTTVQTRELGDDYDHGTPVRPRRRCGSTAERIRSTTTQEGNMGARHAIDAQASSNE